MRAADALDTSDPHHVEQMRQPFADPFQIGPNTWALQRPNWGLPYISPEPAVEAVERQMRAEDI